ncbi:hypothetical protein C7H85_19180, partial [Zobellella endophytica]
MDTLTLSTALKVSDIQGTAYAVLQDGTLEPIEIGKVYPAGTVFLVDTNTRLQYLNADDATEDTSSTEVLAVAGQAPLAGEVGELQAAILAGIDPTTLFEATAAGPAAGADTPVATPGDGSGNGGFIVVSRVGGFTQPEAGFDTSFAQATVAEVSEEPGLVAEPETGVDSQPTLDITYDPPATDPETPPVFPGRVSGTFGWVDESALSGGSQESSNNESTSGALIIGVGGDGLALVEVLDAGGNWIDVTSGGTVAGLHGVLQINPDFTWVYTLTGPAEHPLAGQVFELDNLSDLFQVRVTDDDGDSSTASLEVLVNDDGPQAADDRAGQANENEPVTIDVFANDSAGADGVDLASGVALVAGSLTGSG